MFESAVIYSDVFDEEPSLCFIKPIQKSFPLLDFDCAFTFDPHNKRPTSNKPKLMLYISLLILLKIYDNFLKGNVISTCRLSFFKHYTKKQGSIESRQ